MRFKMSAVLALAVSAALGIAPTMALAATEIAIFAGGCFWCVESDFDAVPGVVSTTSGYIGGTAENPTYHNHEGFREAVQIEFDPAKVSYPALLDVFWHAVDPTDDGGQFCDRGHSYTTAIYAVGDKQLAEAGQSKQAIAAELGKPIVTEILTAPKFWPAEDYHQDYYKKNPLRYTFYRHGCGRDARIEAVWGAQAHKGIPAH